MFDISPVHLILFLGIALVVLGPRRLPDFGRNLGRGMREFRASLTDGAHEPAREEAHVEAER